MEWGHNSHDSKIDGVRWLQRLHTQDKITVSFTKKEFAVSGLTVLVPTLNEEPNVDLLVESILGVRASCDLDFDILFVDSASSDETCQKILAWATRGPVSLLQMDVNVGLAGAVIAGAKHLLSDFILVMDADLSHPPEAIPRLLGPLKSGSCDMVIGSRYIQGGSTPDWPFTRKLSSKLATLPALLFCDVRDPLAGFFAVRREKIINLPGRIPGFKIGLALIAEYGKGFRVTEVPIEFRDRDYGESKMGKRVVFDYCRQLVSIAFSRIT